MLQETRGLEAPVDGSRASPGNVAAVWPGEAIDYRRWLVALLVVGSAWRIGHWALAMPLWRDEANLGLNILRRTFGGLTTPLDYFQVAPLLFLWGEKVVIAVAGAGDRAVRFLPTLASVSALLFFARLAVRRFAPRQAAFAVGFLASAYYATRYGGELKPYSLDLLASVLILGLALDWIDRPDARSSPVLLIAVTPLLIGASYPSVFVAGGAGLALAGVALREKRRGLLVSAGLYLGITTAAFLLFYLLAAGGQDRTTGPAMRTIWVDAFPPANPWRLPLWLLDIHTGNLAAYPVGGRYGGSTVTFLLMVAGALALWRARRRETLGLLLLPFGLNLVAGAFHRYPYGDSARIAQHLAPAVCLLSGCGAADLLDRIRVSWRERTSVAILAALCILGIVGLAIDIRQPYKTLADFEVRQIVRNAFSRQPDRRVVVLSESDDVRYLWYLSATRGGSVVLDPPQIALVGDSVSVLAFSPDDKRLRRIEDQIGSRASEFASREDREYRLPLDSADPKPPYCRSVWLTRSSLAVAP